MIKKRNSGFTLIELLVVIAIIGLLSTIVVASLSSVRKKARDTKRVADIKSLQLALEMYFDATRQYPTALSGLAPLYISSVPTDPVSGSYFYAGTGTSASTCSSYHLGAKLEDTNNASLTSDSDQAAAAIAVCTGGGTQFNGASTDCALGAGTEACYDITN